MVPSTISGWLKNVLKSSGNNVLLFTAHSTRSATTSKSTAFGLSMIEILERLTWSNKSTWQRFYKKELCFGRNIMTLWTEEGDLVSNMVLDQTAILWNKILELLKAVKRLQSNSDFMNKIKERSNTALPPSPWKT